MENIDIFGATDVGLVRKNNEDAFLCRHTENGRFILLAAIDGVGGLDAGEVAAEITRKKLSDFYDTLTPESKDITDSLRKILAEANDEIIEKAQQGESEGQMGCVMTSLLIDLKERIATMAHIGDSRLYMMDGTSLIKLSHDHSFVGVMEDEGTITEEEAMAHPRRNEILRAMGLFHYEPDSHNFLEVSEFPIFGNCVFMLCSDGLSDLVNSAGIKAVLSNGQSSKQQVEKLIGMALEAGGKDNVTVVVGHVEFPESSSKVSASHNAMSIRFSDDKEYPVEKKNRSGKTFYIHWLLLMLICGGAIGFFIGVSQEKPQEEAIVTEEAVPVSNSAEKDSIEILKAQISMLSDSIEILNNNINSETEQ